MDRNEAKEILLSSLPEYLERKGIQINKKFRCLCPEHLDHDPSMSYYKQQNICHCFACGVNADIFQLIGWDYNVSSFKEQFEIGCSLFGLDVGQERKNVVKKYSSKKRLTKKEPEIAPLEIRHKVYTAMHDVLGLGPDDEKYLYEIRHLDKTRIRTDYFRLSKKWPDNALRKILKVAGCDPDLVKKVPGFYLDKNGNLAYNSKESGIAILIRDANGKACAVQVRRDTAEKGRRYVWFSSRFAKGGTSPGAAKDVVIPQHQKKILCITEGRFKAEILAQQGNITISVQGVSTWKNIDNIIKPLRDRYELHSIYLMFDSDIMGNIQLLKSLKQMARYLQQIFPDMRLKAGVWKMEYGKGVDDFYFSGTLYQNKNIKYLDAMEVYQKCLNNVPTLLKEYMVDDLRSLPEKRKKAFKKSLQKRNEEQFFPPTA